MEETAVNGTGQPPKVRILATQEASQMLVHAVQLLGSVSVPVDVASKLLEVRAIVVAVNNSIVAAAQKDTLEASEV